MSDLLPLLGLLAVTAGWAALPLLPALREYLRPTDVEPLTMVGRDNADISRFARHFREYAEANLRGLRGDAVGGDYFGKLPDGTHFVRVARLPEAPARGALPDGSHDRLVILEQPTALPGGETFRLEVWARRRLDGGPNATYRAVLADEDLRLGPGSTVLRWIHSAGTLEVGDGCALYGRTSSDRTIRLGRGAGFERLGAPLITVGVDGEAPAVLPATPDLVPFTPPPESRRLGGHLRIEADWFLAPHTLVEGDLVVAGRLHIGTGVRVQGSVKAHGRIEVDPGAVIAGSLVSREDIRLAAGCTVAGPVIAERDVAVEGATVGLAGKPTTVSARRIHLAHGTRICGHVVAHEGGGTAT